MGTLSGGTISMPVKPDVKGLGAKLAEGIRGEAGGIGELGKELGKHLIEGLAVIGIAASVGEFVKKGIEEYSAADALNAQFAAGIKSTGNAANLSVKGMDELAKSISGYSGQAYDSIGKTEQVLQTFTNIKNVGPNKIFDEATTAAANMAAKLGGDASASAIQLGKALNDPVKGMAALRRVGVAFTDSQTKQVKAMVASGDTMGAQKLILGELTKEFGGAAKAAGQTLPGEINRSKVAFGELSKAVVSGIMPIVAPAIGGIADLMNKATPSIEHFSEGIAEKTSEAAKTIKVALAPARAAIADFVTGFKVGTDALGSNQSVFASWGAALYGIFAQIKPAIIQFGASFGPVLHTVGAAFQALLPSLAPLIPQVLKLEAAFSPIHLIFTALAPVLPKLVGLLGTLAATIAGALGQALGAILPVITQVAGIFSNELSHIFVMLVPIVVQLASALGTVLSTVLSAAAPLISMLAKLVGSLLTALYPLINVVLQLVVAFAPLIVQLVQLAATILKPVIELLTAILAPVMGLVSGLVSFLVPAVTAVIDVLVAVVKVLLGSSQPAFNLLGDLWRTLAGNAQIVWNAIQVTISTALTIIRTVISTVIGWITGFWNAEVNGWRIIISVVWNAIHGLISGALGGIRSLISGDLAVVHAIWSGAWNTITGVVSTAWNGIRGIVGNIVSGIQGAVSGIANALSGIPERVRGVFAGIGGWLIDSGRALIGGLITGIQNMIGTAANSAKSVMTAISNFFPHSPAKEGPFSGKGYSLYSGIALAQSLADGMSATSSLSTVRSAAQTMMSAASGSASMGFSTSLAGAGPSLLTAGPSRPVAVTPSAAFAAAGAGQIVNNFNGQMGYTKEQVVDQVTTKQRRALQRANLSRVSLA